MKLGITMLIHNKDDIKFVTEFPCFLGHPVLKLEKVLSGYIFMEKNLNIEPLQLKVISKFGAKHVLENVLIL